jgi:hypothetical protein
MKISRAKRTKLMVAESFYVTIAYISMGVMWFALGSLFRGILGPHVDSTAISKFTTSDGALK